MCVEDRGQLTHVSPSTTWLRLSNSGFPAWQQALLPAEPYCQSSSVPLIKKENREPEPCWLPSLLSLKMAFVHVSPCPHVLFCSSCVGSTYNRVSHRGLPFGLAFIIGLLLQLAFVLPQGAFLRLTRFDTCKQVRATKSRKPRTNAHCWGQGWLGGKGLVAVLAKGKRTWF